MVEGRWGGGFCKVEERIPCHRAVLVGESDRSLVGFGISPDLLRRDTRTYLCKNPSRNTV